MIANWDPSYPRETVDWYDEYIARKAPISTSWFQQPRRAGASNEYLEVRGMGLYTSPGDQQATRVVAPLDDGSICLWDLSGPRKGAIVARSKPGMLEIGGRNDGERSKMISTGITECVSIDSAQKRLYVAVQDGKHLDLPQFFDDWHNLETSKQTGSLNFKLLVLSRTKI